MTLSHLWPVLYWAWILTEIYVAVVTRTRSGKGKVDDRGSMLTLWIVIFCCIFAASWISAATHLAAMPYPEQLSFAATALLALGLFIRVSAIYTLGRAFSANVAIRDTQTLNRSGLFRFARHPSYTGLLLIFFAVGLHLHNWISLLLLTVPTFAALLYRIHVEEDALLAAFGDAYRDYQRTTRRLIPGLY